MTITISTSVEPSQALSAGEGREEAAGLFTILQLAFFVALFKSWHQQLCNRGLYF